MATTRATAVLIAVAVALVVAMLGAADAAPIDVEAVRDVMESTQGDLGESVAVNESEDDSEEVGDMGSYAATKKKLEGKIKKIQAALKKKKVAQCLPVVDLPADRTS